MFFVDFSFSLVLRTVLESREQSPDGSGSGSTSGFNSMTTNNASIGPLSGSSNTSISEAPAVDKDGKEQTEEVSEMITADLVENNENRIILSISDAQNILLSSAAAPEEAPKNTEQEEVSSTTTIHPGEADSAHNMGMDRFFDFKVQHAQAAASQFPYQQQMYGFLKPEPTNWEHSGYGHSGQVVYMQDQRGMVQLQQNGSTQGSQLNNNGHALQQQQQQQQQFNFNYYQQYQQRVQEYQRQQTMQYLQRQQQQQQPQEQNELIAEAQQEHQEQEPPAAEEPPQE